jgi:hypothetical protein
MKPLLVDQDRSNDLTKLASIPVETLSAIADELDSVQGTPRHSELQKLLGLHVQSELTSVLINNLAALSLLRDEGPNDAKEVVEALIQGCREGGHNDLYSSLEVRRTVLEKLIASKPVYRAIKSVKLFSADSLHLHSFKIYCDSRPLFSPDRSQIDSILLFSSLHIVASQHDETEESLRVSLRKRDLQRIVEECTRAIEKIELLEKTYARLGDIEVIQYGLR